LADDTPEVLISRRRILKRIGAGTVIAWSAPMISSLSVPAYAQNYGGEPCTVCGCLQEPTNPSCGGECVCVRSVAGTCECLNTNDDAGFCGPGDTCPPGYVCVVQCDTAATRCIAACP
jgi:hypothetical protein